MSAAPGGPTIYRDSLDDVTYECIVCEVQYSGPAVAAVLGCSETFCEHSSLFAKVSHIRFAAAWYITRVLALVCLQGGVYPRIHLLLHCTEGLATALEWPNGRARPAAFLRKSIVPEWIVTFRAIVHAAGHEGLEISKMRYILEIFKKKDKCFFSV